MASTVINSPPTETIVLKCGPKTGVAGNLLSPLILLIIFFCSKLNGFTLLITSAGIRAGEIHLHTGLLKILLLLLLVSFNMVAAWRTTIWLAYIGGQIKRFCSRISWLIFSFYPFSTMEVLILAIHLGDHTLPLHMTMMHPLMNMAIWINLNGGILKNFMKS